MPDDEAIGRSSVFNFGLPYLPCGFIQRLGLAQNPANTTDTSSANTNEIGNWVGVLFGFL